MWGEKLIQAGLIVAALSLLVARDYLKKPVLKPRKPGLTLHQLPPEPPPERSPEATLTGMVYLAIALAGIAAAVVGFLGSRRWR